MLQIPSRFLLTFQECREREKRYRKDPTESRPLLRPITTTVHNCYGVHLFQWRLLGRVTCTTRFTTWRLRSWGNRTVRVGDKWKHKMCRTPTTTPGVRSLVVLARRGTPRPLVLQIRLWTSSETSGNEFTGPMKDTTTRTSFYPWRRDLLWWYPDFSRTFGKLLIYLYDLETKVRDSKILYFGQTIV